MRRAAPAETETAATALAHEEPNVPVGNISHAVTDHDFLAAFLACKAKDGKEQSTQGSTM